MKKILVFTQVLSGVLGFITVLTCIVGDRTSYTSIGGVSFLTIAGIALPITVFLLGVVGFMRTENKSDESLSDVGVSILFLSLVFFFLFYLLDSPMEKTMQYSVKCCALIGISYLVLARVYNTLAVFGLIPNLYWKQENGLEKYLKFFENCFLVLFFSSVGMWLGACLCVYSLSEDMYKSIGLTVISTLIIIILYNITIMLYNEFSFNALELKGKIIIELVFFLCFVFLEAFLIGGYTNYETFCCINISRIAVASFCCCILLIFVGNMPFSIFPPISITAGLVIYCFLGLIKNCLLDMNSEMRDSMSFVIVILILIIFGINVIVFIILPFFDLKKFMIISFLCSGVSIFWGLYFGSQNGIFYFSKEINDLFYWLGISLFFSCFPIFWLIDKDDKHNNSGGNYPDCGYIGE